MKRVTIRQNKGVALIMAILVVALAATAAVAMVSRQQFDTRRSSNLLSIEQGLLYQQGIEGWSLQILRRDRKNNDTDSSADAWASPLTSLPVDGGKVAAQISDLQGLMNLNNIWHDGQLDSLAFDRFKRLMMVTGVEKFAANTVVDWLDKDNNPTLPDGAEDEIYLAGQIPHWCANRFMESRSELMQLATINKNDYRRMAPFVTALPTPTAINVNTAPKEVLRSLGEGISDSDAQALIEGRGDKGYKSVQEFLQNPALAGRGVSSSGLSVASNYFSVTSHIAIGSLETVYSAVIYRDDKGNSVVVRRAQGDL